MMQRKWLSGGKKKRGFFAALVGQEMLSVTIARMMIANDNIQRVTIPKMIVAFADSI